MMCGLDALKRRPDDETTFVPSAPGAFDRGACRVQHWLEGSEGTDFPPVPGRYHVFLNYGCGWSHQVLQVLHLRGLAGDGGVGVTHVGLRRGKGRGSPAYEGYTMANDSSGCNFACMREVYNADGAGYGVVQLTIPVLFDKATCRVVSNDPAQMLLMLDYWADALRPQGSAAPFATSLYPENLRATIEDINAVVYPGVNNGVYCCWFGEGAAFDQGLKLVQEGLAWVEARLAGRDGGDDGEPEPRRYLCGGDDGEPEPRRYLCGGDAPTLADVRAFPHLFRFDGIYWDLMLRRRGVRIFESLPHTAAYIRRMFDIPEVRDACDLHIATRFYLSDLSTSDSDAHYDRERAASGGWLPTREESEAKRARQGIVPAQVSG